MKNRTKGTMWIVFCVFAGLSLFFACAPTARRAEKSAPVPKLERYEDKAIGFSIEYDAEKLPKDPGPIGPFVFRRESTEGIPSLAMTAGPYPPRTTLEDTTDLITSSLPRMIPGSIIHEVYNQQLIKLTDGTEANYFEIKWNAGGTELITAVVAAKNNDRLIVLGASDSEDGSMQNLTAMVKSLRLDVEVDEAALMARGFGKDGKFVRTDSPAFTLEYPKEFRNQALQANQIFSAGIPQGSPLFSIAISSLNDGEDINKQLKASAEGYANALNSVGSDIKIISQNPIKDYKEFDAYQIQIVWRYQGQVTLTTVVHIIAKGNKAIMLAGHTVYAIDELLDIFNTINLNP
jgi:hypothetical protein